MRASAALQDYLILRFGADPVFEEVMTAEHLFGMLHRLDVGTSGCLLVAKNEEAFRRGSLRMFHTSALADASWVCVTQKRLVSFWFRVGIRLKQPKNEYSASQVGEATAGAARLPPQLRGAGLRQLAREGPSAPRHHLGQDRQIWLHPHAEV